MESSQKPFENQKPFKTIKINQNPSATLKIIQKPFKHYENQTKTTQKL